MTRKRDQEEKWLVKKINDGTMSLAQKRDQEERLIIRKRDEVGVLFQKKVEELWETYHRRRREVNEERRQLFPERVITVEAKIKEDYYYQVNDKLAALPKREEVTDLSVTVEVQP